MVNFITVSALNSYAKAVLNSDEGLRSVVVCGEVTNFVRHFRSGHCYFTLRDANASIKCVLFNRSAAQLDFSPEDGMLVLAYGSVTLYERDGAFQLYVDFMRPYGVGAAQKAFDRLKATLEKEGLFAPEHKKPLPAVPGCIGVVTSATGAALQDIKNVLSRRWPQVLLLLAPVNVQGLEAADQIVQGIEKLDKIGKPDVIIVARGGGSREDLWVFNSEKIARAAFACKTPIVSAVGHEIDFTILDYVADKRAPTPSAAAEICVPSREEQLQKIYKIQQNIQYSIQSRLRVCYNRLEWMQAPRQLSTFRTRLEGAEKGLRKMSFDCQSIMQTRLERCSEKLAAQAARAHSLSPYVVMARGYALVERNGTPVKVNALSAGESIILHGNDADAQCRVETVMPKETIK